MNLNTRKILLGLSLLGATNLIGFATPASAKPKDHDVKEARKELKEARKDRSKADSYEEYHDANEDVRQERQDYREEREERRDNRPAYNRPGYHIPPHVNPARTVEGVVTNDLQGNDFLIRTSDGRTLRIVALHGESNRISRGDIIRAMGRISGSTLNASSVSILRNGNSNPGNSHNANPTRTLQGTVTDDWRGNDFVVRTSNGRTVRVVALKGESDKINRGDIIEAIGHFSGNNFNAQRVVILRNR